MINRIGKAKQYGISYNWGLLGSYMENGVEKDYIGQVTLHGTIYCLLDKISLRGDIKLGFSDC